MESFKNTDWIPTCDRTIAFLDIMGFKELVMRNSHEELLEKLTWLTTRTEVRLPCNNCVKIVRFSDSIMVISKDNNRSSLQILIFTVIQILQGASMRGIPIKGAIASGTMTCDFELNIFFGQPLIDAYLLEEDLLYYGVISHHTFLNDKIFAKYFWYSKTPLKSGKIFHENLNWFYDIEMLKKFYDTVSGASRRYVDNTIEQYLELKKTNKDFIETGKDLFMNTYERYKLLKSKEDE